MEVCETPNSKRGKGEANMCKKRMKRILVWLLAFVILTGCMPKEVMTAKTTVGDAEMKRIQSYKLFTSKDYEKLNAIVTGKQMYAGIAKFLKPYGAKAAKKFKSCVKKDLNKVNELTITDVFRLVYIAAYSADSTGKSHYLKNRGNRLSWAITYGNQKKWSEQTVRSTLQWSDYNQKEPYCVWWGSDNMEPYEWGLDACAFFYCNGQVSQLSGKPLYEAPWNTDFKFLSSYCSTDTAIRMLGRLFEIEKGDGINTKSSQSRKIEGQADALQTKILNSVSDYEGKGKVYYVSTSGNDENDGLSESTPWETLEKASFATLNPGDTVLFKRGDIWKGQWLDCQKGVTYSAYGTGPKPAFYGTAEEPNDQERWGLYYSDQSGKKIWKYDKQMQDIGGIIFDGDKYADRIYAWWNGDKYVCMDNSKKVFDVKKQLSKNLTFCSLPDFTGLKAPFNSFDVDREGDIYFRCDSGNPATVCKNIQFECSDAVGRGWYALIGCEQDCVIDNIALMYWTKHAFGANSLETSGITIRNCEVGFGGNGLHSIIQSEPTKGYMLSGDGIYGICNGALIQNNYVHDVDGAGITWENAQKGDNIDQPITISGNLVERCGQGIWIHTEKGVAKYKQITIKDNLVLHTGEGYVHGCWCDFVAIDLDNLGYDTKKLTVENNVVHKTKECVFNIDGNYTFENNTFFRYQGVNPIVISDGMQYYIDIKNKNATLLGSYNTKNKSMKVSATISYQGKKYEVKSVASKAFNNVLGKSKIELSGTTKQKKLLNNAIKKSGYKGNVA